MLWLHLCHHRRVYSSISKALAFYLQILSLSTVQKKQNTQEGGVEGTVVEAPRSSMPDIELDAN